MANQYSDSHGQSKKGKETPAYRSWSSMKSRCLSKKSTSYDRYGALGISVCERWMSFENFYADMGDRPEGTSLDRIDNSGNYEPGNCRWATRVEQQSNRRCTVKIDCFGKSLTAYQWAKELGMSVATVIRRINDGMPPELAFTTPPKKGRRIASVIAAMAQGEKV